MVDGISILGIARVGRGDARFGSVGNGVGNFDADGKIKPNCATTGAANVNNRTCSICLILRSILFKPDTHPYNLNKVATAISNGATS